MDMLTLSHVAKRFGEKQVLRDVTFSVPEHTVFGFVGKNGAGKTTAMKLILGLLASDGGEISVNGMKVRYGNTPTNRFVGYLPDVPEFYSCMTPFEYLRFCGEISGMSSKEIKARSEELLCLVGLEKENRRIRGFSRGMKQRLGVAQALFGRPGLLICDEPTSALDPAGRRELLDILSAAKEQTTVLFSTHILSDVEHICEARTYYAGLLEEAFARAPIFSQTWNISVMKLRFCMREKLFLREPLRKCGRTEKLPEWRWNWNRWKTGSSSWQHFPV